MRAAVLLLALVFAGCGAELNPVPMPDMSRSDPPVRQQIRELHARALQKKDAASYGELAMALHAAEYVDAAEPAYRNAQVLAPDDPSWPYYLGLLYRRTGATDNAVASFKRVLELRPADVPALVWLGRTYLDQGRATDAEAILTRARTAAPRSVAVVAALGQSALARADYRGAVSLLEEALSLNPRAQSLHSPLASAYRALGDTATAEAHLKQWRDTTVPLDDPLGDRLATTLRSAVSFESRGLKAFDAGDFTGAAAFYREGLSLTTPDSPAGRSLLHKLGLALYLSGDARAGVERFEEAARRAPAQGPDEPASRAHYSLGVIYVSSGRMDDAIAHLTQAVAYDPNSVAARLALANTLRSARRDEPALPQYEEVIRLNPQAADARLQYALSLIRLRRYAAARTALEEAVRAQPDHPELAHALARVLAAAPDARVRDPQRALAIVDELLKSSTRTEIGETMAMTFADVGQFDEAAAVQRGVIAAAEKAGLAEDVRRMKTNLHLYETHQPCRTPWPDDDPIHRPAPPVSPQLAAAIQ